LENLKAVSLSGKISVKVIKLILSPFKLEHLSKNKESKGFEVLTAVKMLILVFWVVMQCGLASAEDGDSMFLQNSGIYLQVHMVSQPKRPTLIRKARLSVAF
jgi:hypothetical protein